MDDRRESIYPLAMQPFQPKSILKATLTSTNDCKPTVAFKIPPSLSDFSSNSLETLSHFLMPAVPSKFSDSFDSSQSIDNTSQFELMLNNDVACSTPVHKRVRRTSVHELVDMDMEAKEIPAEKFFPDKLSTIVEVIYQKKILI